MNRLGELVDLLNAQLVGDTELQIHDAKTTLRATETNITFVCSEEHLDLFLRSDCLAALIPPSLETRASESDLGKSFLIVENPESAFTKIVEHFRPAITRNSIGISPAAIVSPTAIIAKDVDIYPGAYIGEHVQIDSGTIVHPNTTILDNCRIGADNTLFPNVVLYENTVIGDRCLIHGGVVIGAYGFGYKSNETHVLSAQLGNVVIGDDVEIGSNSTIDRGTFDSTTIGSGTKLDDLVMIGHNCQIGQHNLFCSQVGIAGSTVTGDYVVMAGQVGIGDHLQIGQKVTIAAKSGVMHNLQPGQVYLGAPARPAREQMQIHATIAKLPEMRKQLKQLQRMVDELTAATSNDIASEAA